jgi:signal transduction histidine kinase
MRRRVLAARLPGLETRWLDPALAVIFLVAVELELLTAPYRHGPALLNALVIALMTLPLAWRRHDPLPAALVVLSATLLETILLTDVTQARTTVERPRAIAGLAACLATAGTASIALGSTQVLVRSTVFVTTSWAVGRAMRARRLLARELEEKAARAEAEREDRARLAVADERTRIARELQAVVAHKVSAMVVGAEAASYVLDTDPAGADAQMLEVERTGRQALEEMRRILGVLRAEEAPERQPQPGMGQLPALLERGRAAGLAIELRVEGEPAPLPAAVDLTAYRFLQESLAGTLEHAHSHAAVIVRYPPASLELELHDDGPADGRPEQGAAVRLRERVAVFGGEVRWGPGPGGFTIHATLPTAFDALGPASGDETRPQATQHMAQEVPPEAAPA